MFQDIPTVVGQAYVLSFAASGSNWDGWDDNDWGTVTFGPVQNERFFTLTGDIQDGNRLGWLTFTYEIIATTNPTRLQFFATAGQCVQVRCSAYC